MSVEPTRDSGEAAAGGSDDAHTREVESRIVDKYQLFERLGGGGMGDVFRARHLHNPEWIRAVKLMRPQMTSDRSATERFRRESLKVVELNHSNIVRAFDAGATESGEYFLVMELVRGEDLDQLLRRRGRVPVEEACAIVHQAALGLQHICENGLVHRDVKPANLVLTTAGVVKILDLGLVKEKGDADLTRTGCTPGTPRYMSPEQFGSTPVDIRSDVYSLGCTFWHLLAGAPPFGGSSPYELASAHVQTPLPDITQSLADLDDCIVDVLETMLAKEPGDRFTQPSEVADALEPFACSPDQLRRLLAHAPGDSTEVGTGLGGAGRSSTVGRSTRKGRTALRRARTTRLAWVVSACVALLLVVAVLVWRRAFGGRGERAVVGASASHRYRLQSLPGLHGNWWFEETPWLMPALRADVAANMPAEFAESLTSSDSASLSDGLVGLVAKAQTRPRYIPSDFWKLGPGDRPSEAAALKLDDDQWRQMLASLKSLAVGEGAAAADLHMLAVLKHHYGELDAGDVYRQAAQRYSGDPELKGLHAQCLLDHARWCFDRLDWRQAEEQAVAAAEAISDDGGRMLHVAAYLLAADARMQSGARQAAVAEMIDRAYGAAGDLESAHPLRGWLNEKKAWLQLERFQLKDARESFSVAQRIYAKWPDDDVAAIHVLHTRHGLAMVQRFGRSDDEPPALSQYQSLRADILKQLEKAASCPRGVRAPLAERLFNTSDRLADCVLFDASASAAEVKLARDAMADTLARDFKEVMHADLLRRSSARLIVRNALLAASLDEGDLVGPNDLVDHLEGMDSGFREIAYAHGVADALIDMAADRRKNPAEAPKLRLEWKEAVRRLAENYSGDFAAMRRDRLELLLFAARRWCELAGDRGDADLRPAAEALERVISFASTRGSEIREYLRQYFDEAIRAWSRLPGGEAHVARLVETFHQMKESSSASGAEVLFYFPSQSHSGGRRPLKGVAVVRPVGGAIRLCALAFTASDVLEGRALQRDPALEAAVAGLGKGPVVIRWTAAARGLLRSHFQKGFRAHFDAAAEITLQ